MQKNAIFNGVAVAVLMCVASAAQAITPAGTPPTFYCSANRPVDADTVEAQLNTVAVSATDRGNQPRWEYATPSSPGVSAGPDPLPTPAAGWVAFAGTELSGYFGGLSSTTSLNGIGFYPAQAGAVDNTMRYFRYRFVLDPTVDPTTYVLSIPGYVADDAVRGTYLNGKRVSTGAAATIGGGATPDLQWRTGQNELVIAVFDTISSATWMRISAAQQTVCDYRAAPAAVPTVSGIGLAMTGGMVVLLAGWLRRRRR